MPASPCSDSLPQGQALPPGTRLEEFVIEKVLGSGGFGITYLARDSQLGRQVVIKENLPAQFCFRDSASLAVRPRHSQGEDAENFAYSLASFEQEAMTLASLDHPGIVKVLRRFEAFGTAYFVMPFVEGAALDDLLKRGKHFWQQELQELLQRLLSALGYLHERGIYHRDIKPGNILISAATGEPVLIDFGAARQRLGEKSLTVIESAGYTPFEQLQTRGKVGPWSDIYALGATFYKVLTGETPAKAADRVLEDSLVSLSQRAELQGLYSEAMLSGADRALAPHAADRFQQTQEWIRWLDEAPPAAGTSALPLNTPSAEVLNPSKSSSNPHVPNPGWSRGQKEMAITMAIVLLVLAAMAWIIRGGSEIKKFSDLSERNHNDRPEMVQEGSIESTVESKGRPPEETEVAPKEPAAEPPGGMGNEVPYQNSLGMKFVPVPGTSVLMCVHETRNLDYAAYASAQSRVDEQWRSRAGNGNEQHPVVCVSYEDAAGFCRWLSAKEGKKYRLPTDEEWSAAVGLRYERGRTPAEKESNALDEVFPWGGYYPPKPVDGNYGVDEVNDGYEGTAPVMSFKANGLGIYDLGGNVWEWCRDWYDEDINFRVLRGASYYFGGRLSLRSSYRLILPPLNRNGSSGFRCVLDEPQAGASKIPAKAENLLAGVTKERPHQNSLGMAFVPAGTPGVLFSVWETRVMDFEAFVEDSGHDAISANAFGEAAETIEPGPEYKEAGGSWRDPRFPTPQTPEHPVVCVSYLDAEAFCDWLTKKERASGKIPAGASYRLPTDSEWSRACGGSEYPWGDSFPPNGNDGNYAGVESMVEELQGESTELSKVGFRDLAARTSAVGMFKENQFGLHDMGGNVWEWCSTWYTADLNDAETLKEQPSLKDVKGGRTFRVLRGAAWLPQSRVYLRSSFRSHVTPMLRDDCSGFRCVLVMVGVANEADEPPSKTPAPAPAGKTDSLGDQGAVGKVVEEMLPGEISMKFVFCPPGSFLMGSPRSEKGRESDEEQVQVQISQGFWLAQTEVTQRQWAAVMGSNPSRFKGDDLPVEQVSWEDAQAFITKLNQTLAMPAGWQYALPTEAQWEYACRAGEKGPYSGGSLDEVGWYIGNSGNQTHEMGRKKPNAWGLHDMHGNVWEWCSDWYDVRLKGGLDPTGPKLGDRRVYRGGSWYYFTSDCRAAYRCRDLPSSRSYYLGFRPALVPSK